MQGEGANTERSQLHRVQQGDLDGPIRLCASTGPVLVTLYLQGGDASTSLASMSIETSPAHCRYTGTYAAHTCYYSVATNTPDINIQVNVMMHVEFLFMTLLLKPLEHHIKYVECCVFINSLTRNQNILTMHITF